MNQQILIIFFQFKLNKRLFLSIKKLIIFLLILNLKNQMINLMFYIIINNKKL